MKPARSIRYLPILFSLAVASCTDAPTDLGLDLVDVQAGEPRTITIESSAFEPSDVADVTGGYLGVDLTAGLVSKGASRALAGNTDDPSLGHMDATGSFDFIPLTGVTDAFRIGTVSSVRLTLVRDYVYGDTLGPVTLSLAQIQNAWNGAGARSDTVITAGPAIMEFSFSPNDQTVVVDLPAAWMSANDALLRSETLANDFYGFQLSPVAGNAVVGFDRDASEMHVFVQADSLVLGLDEVATHVGRVAVPTPSEFLLLQDGVDVAAISMDLDRTDFTNSAVHSAALRVDSGTPDLITPEGFVRPLLSTVELVAVSGSDERRDLLATAEVDVNGQFTFTGSDLRVAMQNTAKGIGDFVRFELVAPQEDNTLDPVFFRRDAVSGAPRLILTITEIN